MTTPRFEHFLARLYTDEDLRKRFVTDPDACALAAGLSPEETEALASIDMTGLELAARSYAGKRKSVGSRRRGGLAALRRLLGV